MRNPRSGKGLVGGLLIVAIGVIFPWTSAELFPPAMFLVFSGRRSLFLLALKY